MKIILPPTNIDKMKYSGTIAVSDEVPGEIDLVMEYNKCSLDMKTCEKYDIINIREMCKKFQDKNAFYSNIFAHIKPPLKCPIKPGNYTLEESSLDLAPFALFPIDGYIWVLSFKFASGEKGIKGKKVVMCLNAEVKIIRTRKQ